MEENDKVLGILAYIPVVGLISVAVGSSQFARFHANQGLILFIAEVILGVLIGITVGVLSLVPFVGQLIGTIISSIFGLIIFILLIMGIINAANGEMKSLPVIGGIKLIK